MRDATGFHNNFKKHRSQPSQYIVLFDEIFVRRELPPLSTVRWGWLATGVSVENVVGRRKGNITPGNTEPPAVRR